MQRYLLETANKCSGGGFQLVIVQHNVFGRAAGLGAISLARASMNKEVTKSPAGILSQLLPHGHLKISGIQPSILGAKSPILLTASIAIYNFFFVTLNCTL